jgi:hypothetical protein
MRAALLRAGAKRFDDAPRAHSPGPHREHERALRQHGRSGVSQPAVGGGARERARRRQAAWCAWRCPAAAARPLRQQGPERRGALRIARGHGRRRSHRAAGQLVGHGVGAGRCHRQEQRARSVAPGDFSQLRRGRPGADERALQLLALSFRRACRHARCRADVDGEGRRLAPARVPHRAGLQLRPGGAARSAPATRRAAPRRGASSATNCTRWAR